MLNILIKFLDLLFNLAAGLFLLRLFFDEVNPGPSNNIVRLVHRITEPVLVPIRKILPLGLKDKLYIDISPLIAFLLIIAIKFLTIKTLSVLFFKFRGRPIKFKLK
jgi:YggT family protein